VSAYKTKSIYKGLGSVWLSLPSLDRIPCSSSLLL
jgi:hypothetical protein